VGSVRRPVSRFVAEKGSIAVEISFKIAATVKCFGRQK
jgi:hypothetical protein